MICYPCMHGGSRPYLLVLHSFSAFALFFGSAPANLLRISLHDTHSAMHNGLFAFLLCRVLGRVTMVTMVVLDTQH